ncbi:quinone-dependent dihydroorotate dehydrogenase [Candidatus Uhrbacteria bacterium]|nr:quinone-dependent dihydroorotate dehydrogenase [Candidatus Uhrbacteria bacterium]
MIEHLIRLRNNVTRTAYQKLLKQFFFSQDPEDVHEKITHLGVRLGAWPLMRVVTDAMFSYHHPSLRQTVDGISFSNPIGLAAGFDKNASLTDILPSVGFGFVEVGSITGEPCEGNPRPRLWRLQKSGGLVVYYGLKNDGCEAVAKKMKQKKYRVPVGISIAKTNCQRTVDVQSGIDDYAKAFLAFQDIGDYCTINISCPNAFGGEPFTNPSHLRLLLERIDSIPYEKPIYLKLASDLTVDQLDGLLDAVAGHRISGFISTNLAKKRDPSLLKDTSIPEVGGISGVPVRDISDNQVRYLYQKTKGAYTIIGCGGVFSAEDAYRKIRGGASLIQLITGMIFEGPQLISSINQGFVKLLKKDGFSSITQAIGADFH